MLSWCLCDELVCNLCVVDSSAVRCDNTVCTLSDVEVNVTGLSAAVVTFASGFDRS